MSGIDLVPKTLQYGKNHCESSTFVTFVMIISFITLTYSLYLLHFKLYNSERLKTGKKRILRFVPIITLIFWIIVFVWWVINRGLHFDNVVWQADYFVGFYLNLTILILSSIWWLQLKLRRKPIRWIVNGTFKVSLIIFAGLFLTPYYVYNVSFGEWIYYNDGFGEHAFYSLMIFIIFCLISVFVFGRLSALAPLVPVVILWGACISYFDGGFAIWHGVSTNGTSMFMFLASIVGFNFLKNYENSAQQRAGIRTLMYSWLLAGIILIFWVVLWNMYDYPLFGTDYKGFDESSWH